MKKLLIIFLWFVCLSLGATNYHVKTGGDDGANGDITHPWATIDKVNSIWAAGTFNPGDNIYFNKGDTFYGTILASESGTNGSPITISAYGTGANPIISEFITLTSWTQVGATDVYYATLDVPRLNIVTLDGVVKGMGRFPNTGYLNYETHSNNTSITDNELTGATDWTGAEIGIRKIRQITDRHVVTNHTNGTLTYNSLNNWGNNTIYAPKDKNGYFFQNNINCLDGIGDWCYDAAIDRIYMHFGGGVPGSYTVKAGGLDYNIDTNQRSYIDVNNIDFEGANISGLYIKWSGTHININDCNFYSQGGMGIYATATLSTSITHITVTRGIFTNVLNAAIKFNCNNATIDGVVITNVGTIQGAGRSGDDTYLGIFISGDNGIIKNCKLTNIGWNGISFLGDDMLIENNIISTFCTVKDDGGAIYSVNSDRPIIRNNIFLNAIGIYLGAESEPWEPFGKATGIYLDASGASSSHNAIVSGNTIAHGEWGGIEILNTSGNSITNNTIYDVAYSLNLTENTTGTIRNTAITENKFIAKASTQKTLYIELSVNENPSLFGTFDNNYYARPIDDDLTIQTTTNGSTLTHRTLAGWQSFTGEDANSHKSSVTVADTTDIDFYYNATNTDSIITLTTPMTTVDGIKYKNQAILTPFTSIILMVDPDPSATPSIVRGANGKTIRIGGKLIRQ